MDLDVVPVPRLDTIRACLIWPQLQCLDDRPPVSHWQSHPGVVPAQPSVQVYVSACGSLPLLHERLVT